MGSDSAYGEPFYTDGSSSGKEKAMSMKYRACTSSEIEGDYVISVLDNIKFIIDDKQENKVVLYSDILEYGNGGTEIICRNVSYAGLLTHYTYPNGKPVGVLC